ncbi:hypothetical protein [uncultured Ruminococcus sp.]|nr:hypothetical protein [uncultured Ruminococcus sp.]
MKRKNVSVTAVGDGFPDVPFTKIALQFLCGHGVLCHYDTDEVKWYLA